jgi:hypothetical protein
LSLLQKQTPRSRDDNRYEIADYSPRIKSVQDSRPDQFELIFIYQDFGGLRARVVIGRLRETVGAGTPQHQLI